MCIMCEGATLDEVLFNIDSQIERNGWFGQYVTADPPWAYTIGLASEVAHPELIVVGLESDLSYSVLSEATARVFDGEQFYAGEQLELHDATFELLDVHSDHFGRYDTFNMWCNYYGAVGSPDARPRALQLRHTGIACDVHAQPRLDEKGSQLGYRYKPNRATRRAAERKARRRPPSR